ncbi:head-tail connector protein [Shouchella clausii]|uniref:head-tail connector protein n=1 Tax=Shouchella clausii TaxID=79880 RepID=UPI002E1ABB94|nr:head-tail connector protein [Shouchella clausii]MED4159631.1 head-tail connector protein [Shouchella clausii]MED4177006.1 head-tail connector protein [Shouchella clausii]
MLNEVKQYLRIEEDWTEEDQLITGMIEAGKIFIKQSTGKTFDKENNLHRLCLSLYVSHQYENRDTYTLDKHKDLSFSLANMLTLIKYGSDIDEDQPDD